jgi:hypothetical protein
MSTSVCRILLARDHSSYQGKDFMEIILSENPRIGHIPNFVMQLLEGHYKTEVNIAPSKFPCLSYFTTDYLRFVTQVCAELIEVATTYDGWVKYSRSLKDQFMQVDELVCNKIVNIAKSVDFMFSNLLITEDELTVHKEPHIYTTEFYKHVIQDYHEEITRSIMENAEFSQEENGFWKTLCMNLYYIRYVFIFF